VVTGGIVTVVGGNVATQGPVLATESWLACWLMKYSQRACENRQLKKAKTTNDSNKEWT